MNKNLFIETIKCELSLIIEKEKNKLKYTIYEDLDNNILINLFIDILTKHELNLIINYLKIKDIYNLTENFNVKILIRNYQKDKIIYTINNDNDLKYY
jgi:hypothetical protein